VVAQTPADFTLLLDRGLLVKVSLPAGTPVVDSQGLDTALTPPQEVRAFVRQISDLSLSAVLVFAEDEEKPDGKGGGDHGGKGGDDYGGKDED
jgi:hypothetical protein